MNSPAVFLYVLKTILVSGIFLGYYWAALRNKKFHYYNRFYLLISLAASIVIPLLNFTWITIDEPVNYGAATILNYIVNNGATTTTAASWSWSDWALTITAFVAIGFLSILIVNITKIYRIKRASVITKMGDIDFIETEEASAPFSYLNNLFWKRSIKLEQDEGKKIFRHELTHIQQKHTWDKLFCQVLCSVLWVNPFYWLIQKELLTIHEFIADEQAIGDADTESFARMLLQAHYGDHFLHPSQSFFYSSIKRRLIMLTTSKNTRYSYARRLIALPLLAFIITFFSLEVNARSGAGSAPPSISFINEPQKNPTQEQKQVEPKFRGGKQEWQNFLSKTLKRDIINHKGGPPGKYEVRLNFIVDKDGSIKNVRAENNPGYGTKEEAIRTLSLSPKWDPATLNGKSVDYRDKITITYVVSED